MVTSFRLFWIVRGYCAKMPLLVGFDHLSFSSLVSEVNVNTYETKIVVTLGTLPASTVT